jgi:hypothetical protein
MNNLKKNLQSVNKELKALAKKVDGIIIAIDKLEKPKATKKPKVKPVKAKTVKKTPVIKAAVKKAAPATAVDTVLAIIKRSKKGVGTAALMEKTGYNRKKIANLVFSLGKQG